MTTEQRKKMSQSKIGVLNPRYGKPGTCLGQKHSPEAIQKIKEARASQIITVEHRRKISSSLKLAYKENRKSKKSLSWYIDGRNEGNLQVKKSLEYKLWKTAVFERDNYTCQDCKVRGGELQGHHIKPQSVFPELRFAIDNGITLCRTCHLKTDTWGMKPGRLKEIVGTQS